MRLLLHACVICTLAVAFLGSGGISFAGEASPPSLPALVPQPSTTPSTIIPLVPFEKLTPLLPTPPPEWKAEGPQGSTTDSDELRFTTAQRTYYKGSDENAQTTSITIIDFAASKTYLETLTAGWKLNSETPEGYDKPVDIDGMRGFEHYVKAIKGSSLAMLVGSRYFVQVELTNQDPKDLREWFKRIDVKKLTDLK